MAACGSAAWCRSACTGVNKTLNLMKQFWQDLTLSEISGAMGDLGTFLPLLVGLTKAVGLDLGTTLLFTGAYNMITGALFDLPMPVQPMKTIAAVALAESGALTLPQVLAAGIFVSACVLALGVLGLMGLATRLIPGAVIRGMQLGLGLALSLKGFQQVWYANSKGPPTRLWWTVEGLFLGLFSLAFIMLSVYPRTERRGSEGERQSARSAGSAHELGGEGGPHEADDAPNDKDMAAPDVASSAAGDVEVADRAASVRSVESPSPAPLLVRQLSALGERADAACGGTARSGRPPPCTRRASGFRTPAALFLIFLGIVLTVASSPSVLHSLRMGPSKPQVIVPSAADWRIGILRAGLPQLSLTVFNSVISVCQLAGQLFPDRPPSPSLVATSVGAMNLVGPWFGAMPCCHGAGGLAAQVRFGARTGAAPVFLGLVKISLALLFGSSLFALLQAFPNPLLGAMLVFAGVELAAVARGQAGQRGSAVMLFTAAVTLAMSNVAIGVAAGLIAAYSLAARDWVVAVAWPPAQRAAAAARARCCGTAPAQRDAGSSLLRSTSCQSFSL